MSDLNQAPDTVVEQKKGSFSSWKGNSYPKVKLRGFYSDIISNQNADKTGVNKFNHFMNKNNKN